MADGTHISWSDATWNPITGCAVTSPGCVPCYAQHLAGTRLRDHPSRVGLTDMTKAGPVWNGKTRFNSEWLMQPVRWRDPRRIFVVAHGDLFYEQVPIAWIATVVNVMEKAKQHEYQVLTKRTHRMRDVMQHGGWDAAGRPVLRKPLPHVLLGTSVESQRYADERRAPLAELAAQGWRTWVSYEPALGPIDWRGWEFVKWIVSGGQSTQGRQQARPSHPDWHRATRDFCGANGIAYHFKQWGSWAPGVNFAGYIPSGLSHDFGGCEQRDEMWMVGKKAAGAVLDGREHREFPT